MRGILNKVMGDPNAKALKKYEARVIQITELEKTLAKKTDKQLAAQTAKFKKSLAGGQTLEDVLVEAFATVRETAKRKLGQRHFDVQLIGGMALHEGNIAEMRTGEGKTLVATLPVYLNALSGSGVHVITVNDFLAQRDAGWMAPVYHHLGLSVSVIINGNQALIYDPGYINGEHEDERLRHLKPVPKKEAYSADITYGTNNEFGFDYLRDNMAGSLEDMVQRPLNFAIVDEVDSILIDEARTPLIISAPAVENARFYQQFATVTAQLKAETDYIIDEKAQAASLTDDGVTKVEKILSVDNLYDARNVQLIYHLEQAIKAQALFRKDKDYVVKDGEVIIVDEFTGRLLPGRRYNEGLHQAIEAKEGVPVLQESTTLATISFQNYFRLYKKLSGMTGTAATEAEEFRTVYNLDVIVVPTNQDMIRKDLPDRIYKNEAAKFSAVVEEVRAKQSLGQPVLLGTASIAKNEVISQLLTKAKISHEVLNAKNHEREARIVAKAGQKGAVTIATNIAGRGTDIVLGEGVVELGGLHVLGSERHEARRIDNQLRGRAGRQGDPGSSQFYVSLEDDLMRIFGGEKIASIMTTLRVEDDVPIENKMVSKAIERAQQKIESHNYDIRKRVLQYDDVMNRHREAIYARRRQILKAANLKQDILGMIANEVKETVSAHINQRTEELDFAKTQEIFSSWLKLPPSQWKKLASLKPAALEEELVKLAQKAYSQKEKEFSKDTMRLIERSIYLQIMDKLWMEHLESMGHLREGIGWRAVGQRDPLSEYKKEAFGMFNNLNGTLEHEIATTMLKIEARADEPSAQAVVKTGLTEAAGQAVITTEEGNGEGTKPKPAATIRTGQKTGRNDPCPCGSGLKYKKCGLIGAPEHKSGKNSK